MSTAHMTDTEFEDLLAKSLSAPAEVTPSPELAAQVWHRIDAWEAEARPEGILTRLLNARLRNGERVLVLLGALLFGTLFVGAFLTGSYYLLLRHPLLMLRLVQIVLGPNVQELHSLTLLGSILAIGGLLLGGLALSERLFSADVEETAA